MEDAILLVELGWHPSSLQELNETPEAQLGNMMIYKAVKNVMQNGGELKL